MAEPVVRMGSARRTVRVAAALLTGQALLGVVVGWVILGDRGDDPAGPPALLEPMSDRPLALPQLPDGARTTPVPDATTTTRPGPVRAERTPGSAPVRTLPSRPRVAEAPTSAPAAPLPPPRVEPSTVTPIPSLPLSLPSADATPSPGGGSGAEPVVVVGDRCNQWNHVGVTADGTEVRCWYDRWGVLRWRIPRSR